MSALTDLIWQVNEHDTSDTTMLRYAMGLDHTVWTLTYRTAPRSHAQTIHATATISLPTGDTLIWLITPGRSTVGANGGTHPRDTTHQHTDIILRWLTHDATTMTDDSIKGKQERDP